MDERQIEALAERKKKEAREEASERRERLTERDLPRRKLHRIAWGRVVAGLSAEIVDRFDLDPMRFMETVIDAYHNRIKEREEDEDE